MQQNSRSCCGSQATANRGTILDLGPAWQATLHLFCRKGLPHNLIRTAPSLMTKKTGEEERLRSLGINAEQPTEG